MQTPHPAFIPTTGPIAWRQSALPARSPRRLFAVAPAPRCVVSPRAQTPAPTKPQPEGLRERVAQRAAADTALLARGVRDAAVVLCAAAVLATGGVSAGDAGLSVAGPAAALADVPAVAPSAVGVFDDAGVVGKSDEDLFGRATEAIEKRTGVHVRFIVVGSIAYGTSPDEYATQLAGDWGLGPSDVLFVASTKLARAGVFVGEDVRAKLPDDVARSVAEETYGVPAGAERYGAALLGVSNRLIPVLNGEADPGPPSPSEVEASATYKTKEETKNDRGKYVKIVGGVLVISVVAPLLQTYWYVRND